MAGLDLFKKLGAGAKFNFKRFHNDAEKFQLVKPAQQEALEVSKKNLDFFGDEKKSKRKATDQKHSDIDEKRLKPDDSESSESEDEDVIIDEEEEENVEELQILGNIHSKGDEEEEKNNRKNKKKHKKKKKTVEKLAEQKQEQINHFRNTHRIHVHGTDIPDPIECFSDLQERYGVHSKILDNVGAVGFTDPTPIQMQAITVMLERREILACAPTGSGKTAAFILPILHHLKEPRNSGLRALVLAPTRELARQTYLEFNRLGEGRGFRTHLVEKAASSGKKSKKFDIMVTTPNRLVFMLQQEPPMVTLDSVEWLVVDESDKLFEGGKSGFREQLATIYKSCDSKNVRRAMFSATFTFEVEEWCKLNLDNVVQVYIGAKNVASQTVKQELLFVGSEPGKLIAVRDIIREGLTPPVLIFVQSKERAKELFHELIYDGINVDVIHSDRTQLQRDNVVKGFRSGKVWVMICTELMGRGIDFKGVNLVINYDFPNSAISYIHRIGRTGRAGRSGRAVTFFTENDSVNLRSIANVMKEAGCPVPEYMLQMKKPNKIERKKLARSAPKRRTIRTIPKHEIFVAKRKRKNLQEKRKKQESAKNPADNKSDFVSQPEKKVKKSKLAQKNGSETKSFNKSKMSKNKKKDNFKKKKAKKD